MHYDHIIVGAGSMGVAAGYFLAKKGQRVLLLDAFNPPHDQASHHGETRLIRYAYGEGLYYVPMALRAKELWEDLQQQTDEMIFHQTGIINIGYKDHPFMNNVIASAKQFHLPLEVMQADDIQKRWKGLQIPEQLIGCFEPTSGVLRVENCIRSYRTLAVRLGATIRTNSKVVDVQSKDGIVEVTVASGERFTANTAIISVGAWAKQLLHALHLELPLQPTRKTFAWYEADEALYDEQHFPGFAFDFDGEAYYGFPSIEGAGLKMGRHDGGDAIHPDDARIPFGDVATDASDLHTFLQTYMPNVGPLKFGKTCMYSMTPDEDFIIDRHPQHSNITIAAGFSGHGFKFASVVGEILSELAMNEKPQFDLTPFSINRFK